MSIEITDWLRGLGLEQYAAAFRDNDIDDAVLRRLTAEDLRELGVASVGHRRRLLDAITVLGAAAADASGLPSEATAIPAPRGDVERRQLTVMFCDLVGSTPLASRLDPEDLREVIAAYHHAVADVVRSLDGFVTKYMGDGVLIYFGYPQAHEDDAERAVRTGLGVIDAVRHLDIRSVKLQARIGIATGLVVVGDLIGEGSAQEQSVVGETPNLAARLQNLADPDAVVIAESARRQIGTLFDLEDLGARQLAGFAEPQRAWRVLGESGIVSRFEALRSEATPLVGRDEELDLLLRRWDQAKAGEGRVVLVSGEPGIGKSRLTAALSQRIEGEPHTRLRYFCSPHHQDSPLHPFIVQLEHAAGFARDDTVEHKLGKLRALLMPGARSDDEIELLAELLSLPNAAADLNLSPQRKRERLFEALLHQLEALARCRPILMVFEDAHWIDPSSRELLDLTLDRVSRRLVLLVVTFRSEFQHSWSGQPHVMMLALNRLGGRDGAALVKRLAGNVDLAREVVDEIVLRADGVPLFVEELTKAVLESRERTGLGTAVLAASPLPGLTIPATLHASLIARFDRLGPVAKEIAQIGAVLGREFGYELIEPVAQRPAAELRAGLDRLVEAELLFCRGVAPHSSYLFKHALVQDAAYGTLLRSRRQELHARAAAALETGFPETVVAQPELVAHHYTEAGLAERAVPYWHRAGERAVARFANLEAVAHLSRGIEVLRTLPEGPQRDEQELVLQVALITPLWSSRGFGSPQAERVATRALELSRRIGADTPAHFWAVFGMSFFYHVRGALPLARELGEQSLALAERLQDPELLAYGHFGLGDGIFWFGELALARAHLEQAIALCDPEWGRAAAFRHGVNCASNSRMFLARVLWHLGYPDQALSCSQEAIKIAESDSHPFSLAAALSWAAALHQLRREARRTRDAAEAALALATEQIIPFFAAHAMVLCGWALIEQGQCEEGIARLRDGVAAYRATGAHLESPHWLALLAEAYGKTGQTEEALSVVRDALAEVERTGIRYYEAELHRLDGEFRLGFNEAEAEACFQRAIAIARAQQAKSFELRVALSVRPETLSSIT